MGIGRRLTAAAAAQAAAVMRRVPGTLRLLLPVAPSPAILVAAHGKHLFDTHLPSVDIPYSIVQLLQLLHVVLENLLLHSTIVLSAIALLIAPAPTASFAQQVGCALRNL